MTHHIYHWLGAGWYAPRYERNTFVYYWCGDNREQKPDTYPMNLGTPDWFDAQPVTNGATEVKPAGRPPVYGETMEPHTIRMTAAQWAHVRQQGGDLSAGTRAIVQRDIEGEGR